MIEVIGSEHFPKVDVKGIKNNFDIIGGPYEQTSIEFINGKMKNTKTLKWILSPKRSGNLIIPELRGSIDGKLFKSEPIKILVDKGSNEFSKNEIFIIADVDKKNVFLVSKLLLHTNYTNILILKFPVLINSKCLILMGFGLKNYLHLRDFSTKIKKYYTKVGNIRLLILDKGHYSLLHQTSILYHQ